MTERSVAAVAPSAAERPLPARPRLGRIYRRSFWDLYDSMGLAAAANLLWTASLVLVVTAPLGMAATMAVGAAASRGDPLRLPALFARWKSLVVRMSCLFLLDALVLVAGAVNLHFYGALASEAHRQGAARQWAFLLALGLTLWLAVAFILMHLYLPGFLADGRTGFFGALKRAFFAVVGYPATSLLAALSLLPLLVAAVVSVFGLGLLFVSFYCIFSAHLAAAVSGQPRDESAYRDRSLRELFPWALAGGD